jgi:hypothetical protein
VTLRPKFSLCIVGCDNRSSTAHSAQGSGSFQAELPGLSYHQVGDLVGLEVTPHILDRVEFGRIGRKALSDDAPARGRDVILDQGTAMNGRTIPEDQQFSGKVPLEMAQIFDHVEAFDATGVDLEIEPPQRQAPNDRETFPVERLLE